MKGKKHCHRFVITPTEVCGRCIDSYCWIHLARLLMSHVKSAGRVKIKHSLCQDCGYDRVTSREWQRKSRTFTEELEWLATIDIFI